MKIRLLDPEFNSKYEGTPVLESVDGMFTLTSTEEDVSENTYSHCAETVRFTEEWVKQNPDIFEIIPEDDPKLEPKTEPDSKKAEETSSVKSLEEITERLDAVQKDIEFLKSVKSEELKDTVDRYTNELKIVRNTLKWVLNIEETEDGE